MPVKCCHCHLPAIPGETRCKYHKRKHAEYTRDMEAKKRIVGRYQFKPPVKDMKSLIGNLI